MDKRLLELLNDFRKQPAVYIGKKNLGRMVTFISGFIQGIHVETGVWLQFLPGFQEYIEDHYNIHTDRHWSSVIQFIYFREEDAFDAFFKLLDLFLAQKE